jgi:hypothetical protein
MVKMKRRKIEIEVIEERWRGQQGRTNRSTLPFRIYRTKVIGREKEFTFKCNSVHFTFLFGREQL